MTFLPPSQGKNTSAVLSILQNGSSFPSLSSSPPQGLCRTSLGHRTCPGTSHPRSTLEPLCHPLRFQPAKRLARSTHSKGKNHQATHAISQNGTFPSPAHPRSLFPQIPAGPYPPTSAIRCGSSLPSALSEISTSKVRTSRPLTPSPRTALFLPKLIPALLHRSPPASPSYPGAAHRNLHASRCGPQQPCTLSGAPTPQLHALLNR